MRAARLAKAEQFMQAADLIDSDLPDTYVSMCVLAGIAAADVVCCVKLGRHAVGEDHTHAVDLLNSADRYLGKHLSVLLSAKTKAGYSSQLVSAASCKQAGRAANALLEAARLVASTR